MTKISGRLSGLVPNELCQQASETFVGFANDIVTCAKETNVLAANKQLTVVKKKSAQ